MKWISVKERLPEFDKQVLLYWEWFSGDKTRYETYAVGYLNEVTTRNSSTGIVNYASWNINDSYDNTNPTHWAEIEPPKN